MYAIRSYYVRGAVAGRTARLRPGHPLGRPGQARRQRTEVRDATGELVQRAVAHVSNVENGAPADVLLNAEAPAIHRRNVEVLVASHNALGA